MDLGDYNQLKLRLQLRFLAFSEPIILDFGAVDALQSPLMLAEQSICQNYGESRRRDFVAGRTVARRALHKLGHGAVPILKNESGAPIWPSGVTGSISHSGGHCATAVASMTEVSALGLDIQEIMEVDTEFARTVMRADDRHEINETISGVGVALIYFSIREAVYKAYNPDTGAFLEFHDVAVDLDLEAKTFNARINSSKPPLGCGRRQLSGRIELTQRFVAALSWVASCGTRAVTPSHLEFR